MSASADKPSDPADKEAVDQFQPHRAGYGSADERTRKVMDWIERHPHATLTSGEGALLVAYIRKLEQANDALQA